MYFLCLMASMAYGEVGVTIVNNTRVEFNVGREVSPYIANEVALNPHDVGNALDKNKFRIGVRHKANDYVKLDPHVFIQHQRKNEWAVEYGPTLRIDVNF